VSASALERETKEAYRGDEVLRYDLASTGALVVRRRETRIYQQANWQLSPPLPQGAGWSEPTS